jgi:tRNA (guanine-N7-)-methyltransferase
LWVADGAREMRPIRSYVLRQGRTTPAQKRALEELLPVYGLPYASAFISRARVFGRDAPLVLEIGSGMGDTTAAIAQARPDADFIAVEVHGPGVGGLLNRIESMRLPNLKVIRHDAVEVLENMIADDSLAALHLFFPDPWPKKRHHKRRLVQPPFAALVARKLAPGGILHAATDWPDYADHMNKVFSAEPHLRAAGCGFVPRPATRFQARGERLGHPIRDLYFRRLALTDRAGMSPEAR